VVNLPLLQQPRSVLSGLSELYTAFPPIASVRAMFDRSFIRVEDEMNEGRFEVRAELPGLDPAEDIDVTVVDGYLVIQAERTRETEIKGRSEFYYGSFTRSIPLPEGADEDDIEASYEKGILTVSVPMHDERIEVESVDEPVAVPVDSDEPDDED
jgi:HSP20 family protein